MLASFMERQIKICEFTYLLLLLLLYLRANIWTEYVQIIYTLVQII